MLQLYDSNIKEVTKTKIRWIIGEKKWKITAKRQWSIKIN